MVWHARRITQNGMDVCIGMMDNHGQSMFISLVVLRQRWAELSWSSDTILISPHICWVAVEISSQIWLTCAYKPILGDDIIDSLIDPIAFILNRSYHGRQANLATDLFSIPLWSLRCHEIEISLSLLLHPERWMRSNMIQMMDLFVLNGSSPATQTSVNHWLSVVTI